MTNISNKTIACLILIAIAIVFCCKPAHADTNALNILTASKNYTNIVVIPYGKYDLNTKKFGVGAAGLYRVTDNFLSGFRVDEIDGYQTSAGVQAQLQVSTTLFGWLETTPFYETSVGLGSSSLYASTGPGVDFGLYNGSLTIKGHPIDLGVGLIGDYEHVVQNGETSKNSNQLNFGLRIHASF